MSWGIWPPKAKGCPSTISASLLFAKPFSLTPPEYVCHSGIHSDLRISVFPTDFEYFSSSHVSSISLHIHFKLNFPSQYLYLVYVLLSFSYYFFHIFSKGARRPTTHFRGQYLVDTMKLWVVPCSSFSCRRQVLWFFV